MMGGALVDDGRFHECLHIYLIGVEVAGGLEDTPEWIHGVAMVEGAPIIPNEVLAGQRRKTFHIPNAHFIVFLPVDCQIDELDETLVQLAAVPPINVSWRGAFPEWY